MHHSAVHWANGIFLRPHHFQANDRHWNELVSSQQQFDHPVGYGVHSVTISDEALRQGVVEVRGLKLRWKEGSLLSQEQADVHRIPLQPSQLERLQGGGELMVYIAIPIHREGHANITPAGVDGASTITRYRERILEVADESAGGDRQALRLRDLNVRFLFSTDDLNGYEALPIARLRRSTTGVEQLELDRDYFPPVLEVQAWPELASVMRRIHDDVNSQLQTEAATIQSRKITFSDSQQGNLERMMRLYSLNEAAAELTCLAFARGIHPLVAFTALCKIVGRLSIFGQSLTIPADIPRYDHDDLAPLFYWAHMRIRELIFSKQDDVYYQRWFFGSGRGMRVTLDREWFGDRWDWYFGVRLINFTPEECLDLFRNKIQWVLASASEVEDLFTKRADGLATFRVKQLPSVLPTNKDWMYFKIGRENEAWRKVQAEETLALRVQHVKQNEGDKRLRLTYEGKGYELEFAIFAVPLRG
jgi:type VI secretion system protein ImpJ